jgi:ribose transport system ATP-binding protein
LAADPETLVGDLGVGDRQLVELSRLLIERPSVLILDEPNSALNERETQRLFGILRELSADGITVIYVSHRLEEVFDIADRITVMRNGGIVMTGNRAETTIGQVVEAMVGTSPAELFPARTRRTASGPASLTLHGVSVGDELLDISFEARPGEIVGLAGLEGSGVATLLGVLFGTRRPAAGSIAYADGLGAPASPTSAARRGISLVPADRREQGLMLEASVETNIAQVAVGALANRRPWLDRRAIRAAAQRQIDGLRIRTEGPSAMVGRLSGGNQQKVVVAKWLEIAPTVFLLDDPTRGVDVGAKREIYRLIRELADTGRTVLFRSTELPEVVGLADRILVLYHGRLVLEANGGDIDDHALLHAINTGRPPGAEPDNAPVELEVT